MVITCHYCGETGHKAMYCNKMPPEMKEAQTKQEDFRVSFSELFHNKGSQDKSGKLYYNEHAYFV